MKLTFPLVLFLSGTAAAGKVTLKPVPVADPAPSVVGSYAVCKDANDRLRYERLELHGHEVNVWTSCDHKTIELALQSKAGWHVFTSGVGSWSDATTFATIAKGQRALIHRHDDRVDDSGDAFHETSHLDICSYDKDDAPRCGSIDITCPETGCKAPEIQKGALWLHAKGGRQKFTIEMK